MKLHLFFTGELIAGKFRAERILAEGSTAIVIVARHVALGTTAVLKILHPHFLRDPETVERFMREARAVAGLRTEHVVRIFDVDTLADGVPYMVMEHLEGMDLKRLARRGPLATVDAVDAVLQACSGIAEAHAAGVVHRDLKPANLFCTRLSDGAMCIKVLDFGVSTFTPAFSASAAVQTVASELFGSPAYMAPEQIDGSTVDERTDIWALGAILYELLAGRRAFPGTTAADVIMNVAHTAPEPLCQRSPEVPVELAAIVERCLQKAPADRYQAVHELATALSAFVPEDREVPASRRPLVIVTKAAPLPPPIRLPIQAPLPSPERGSKTGWIVAAVAVCGMLAMLAMVTRTAWSKKTADPPPEVDVTSAVMAAAPPATTPPAPPIAPIPQPQLPTVPPVVHAQVINAVSEVFHGTPADLPPTSAPDAGAPLSVTKSTTPGPSAHHPPEPANVNMSATVNATPSTPSRALAVPVDYAVFGSRK